MLWPFCLAFCREFQIPALSEIWFESSAPLASLATMSTLTVHCQLEDETVRERTGHLPSYMPEKMKSLKAHFLKLKRLLYSSATRGCKWLFLWNRCITIITINYRARVCIFSSPESPAPEPALAACQDQRSVSDAWIQCAPGHRSESDTSQACPRVSPVRILYILCIYTHIYIYIYIHIY